MLAALAGRIYDHAPQQNAFPFDGVTDDVAMKESAPWFVWPLLESVGVVFLVLGVPLARRRVPPNGIYGVRFGTTLANESIWYEVNARGGRHCIAIGVAYLALLNGLLLLGVDDTTTIIAALVFNVVAVLLDAVILYRTASRLAARSVAGHSRGSGNQS